LDSRSNLERHLSEDITRFEIDEGVGIITFNRPKALNAMLIKQAGELADLLESLRTRDEIRAILLTGAGGAFCSGIDIPDAQGSPKGRIPRTAQMTVMGPFGRITQALIGAERPVVAAISGVATGAGLAYALACDRRFADPTARLGAVWMKRGFHPDCGITYLLPRIVGVPTALDMISTGDVYDAQRAKDAGLIDELVGEGEAFDAALAYAKRLASGPSVMMGLARRSVHASLTGTLQDALSRESWGLGVMRGTEDIKEGVRSWMKKRPPKYTGF
jgi:2-(1,2-epoxy-1,2-dihydrophenyl)acetyl-CoA isomerase